MASSSKSLYIDTLDYVHSTRYKNKLSLIRGLDPYSVCKEDVTYSVDAFANITYPDIANYLVFNPSPFTIDDIMAYKSMEACNQFVCVWVRYVGVIPVKDDVCVVLAQVQRTCCIVEIDENFLV